jgi:predicted nuclease of predicted toxin-antitoxin system
MLPPLVADMNISPPVVQFLRSQGVDVVSAFEEGWHSYEDAEILANAHLMDRFVLTHDSDFGHLAMYLKHPITGIIHLRPGARPSSEVISDLRDLLKKEVDWTPPLIAVHRFGRLRIRRL